MCCFALLLLLLPLKCFCFNIDTNHFVVYVDPQKVGNTSSNYFGYSVVIYPGDKKQNIGKWIKIGAPKGNDPKIKKFSKTGVVYDCPLMEKCKPVNIKMGSLKSEEKLEGAWIGGSMDISYKFNKLAICGFRTIYHRSHNYDQIGSCYFSRNNRYEEVVPLHDEDKRYNDRNNPSIFNYGLGEAGFSIHIPKNEDAVLLGAPGVYNWVGTMIKTIDKTVVDPIASRLRTRRSYVVPETTIATTSEYTTYSVFQLFGYSTTSGYFFGKKLYYAASAPKYDTYKGKVTVFDFDDTKPVKEKVTVVGNQFGEYFGAAITAGDLNGDNYDDLIVGAPYHMKDTYNDGAVYIFLGSSQNQLKKHHTLYGNKANGQFGSAVMFLDDINNDGFGDLAIGAPYAEEFSGVLYIYKGNKEGIDRQPCQRIIGKNISPEIRGFGISISRSADIDENGYNDLAVGAYLSGHAVLLRSRPVVVVSYKMQSIPKELQRETVQFSINICYRYTHFENDTLTLNRTIIIDELLSRSRLKNSLEGNKLITIRKQDVFTCENVTVVLRNTTNFVAPITVSLSYKLHGREDEKEVVYISEKYNNGTDTFCVRCPVLDEFRSRQPSFISVPFGLGCGPDNFCESQLTIDAKFLNVQDNTFVVGSSDYLNLETVIKNSGENAYSTQIEVMLPDIINLRQIPTECYEQKMSVIICDVENPLKKDKEKTHELNLDMKKINRNNDLMEISITIRVITISNNSNTDRLTLNLTLKREADIVISGKSGEQSVPFKDLLNEMQNFTQIYQVNKVGASPLERVQVNITIPHSMRTLPSNTVFIKVFTPEASFAGQPVMCTSDLDFIVETTSAEKSDKLLSDSVHKRRKRQVEVFTEIKEEKKEDIMIGEKEYDLAPNRTHFLNCSMENIICSSIICTLGPFEKGQAPAVIKIKMMFDPCIITKFARNKDVVLFTTTGMTTIEIPAQFNQSGKRPDFVEVPSLFINESKRKGKVALWIIILALIAGILLLALIIFGLTKLGFFKREKKEELKNLKAATRQMIEAKADAEPTGSGVNNCAEELPGEQLNEDCPKGRLSMEDPTMNASTEGLVDQKDNVFE